MRKHLLLVILLTAFAVTMQAESLQETVDRTLDVRPGSSVDLSNVNGKVVVRAWDNPKVRIQAFKKVQSDDSARARKIMSELKVEISTSPDGITIDTRHPRRNGHDHGFLDWLFGGDSVNAYVNYELTVPRSMHLDIETVNGGINVSDLQGEIELETTNGKIEVSRCSGTVDASTTNGAIRAELLSVTKGKPMRFSTTNGRITLAVPATFAAEIDADTTNGSINSQLPVATRHMSRTSLRGTVNGGGAEVRLRTTNGSISIETLKSGTPQASR